MPKMIELDEVRRLIDAGAQLVDVLSRKEYEDSHLPGAIHLPLAELDAARAAASLDRERPVVAYCFDYQ
jgi:rhodanese-related sulfurtransferase